MADVTRHEPGNFCWAELATNDAAGAKTFYTSLFGWTYNDSPAGPGMVYTMLKKRGKSVGALYEIGADRKGMPPNWVTYITVTSTDEAAKKAKELGAKLLAEPFDVMDAGRMATIQDRQGATFCIWQGNKNMGVEIVNEPGVLCWCELDTTDTASAEKFYTALFGWGSKPSPEYTEFQIAGVSIGGMMKIPKEWGPVPPNWLIYFAVENCDASEKKARDLGARTIVPPMDIEKVGRFSVISDPQGAVFAIYQAAMA